MKTFKVGRPLWGLFLLLCCSVTISGAGIDSTHARRLFKNPPIEYSTGPLWVWNDLLTDQQIRESLQELAQQDIRQVWVHPRPGLMTPYLSAEWFRLWKVTLAEAKHLGMHVWIYDENSYPSGFAGGFVPEAMPDSRGRGLVAERKNQTPEWSTNVLKIFLRQNDHVQDVTASVRAGESMTGTNFLVISEVRAGNAPWNANRFYVNLLSPGVTEKFLELTLEPYRRQLGKEFGRRIPGVFTDEPNIQPVDGWPWSEVLASRFKERWGHDLMGDLASLYEPVGDWRRVRYEYFQLLNDQFIERWSKPYHEYCAQNRLQWTGHYWDHDWPRCEHVPDNMAMYAWHQTPAIDCLMNQFDERVDSQFGNIRMVKELSSVANQLGLKRTLCETYGAGGWDLRFQDMKRIGDWLEVLGVNTINQHLSYVTIRGARKRDHPQSFSYHEPWWEVYHVSARYLARVSAALSQGEQVNSILLLEPTTSAWMYQGDDSRLKEIGKSFFDLLASLETNQVEYDIGSEDILRRHASVSPAGFRVGLRDYRTIILPPCMENLNAATATLLEQFLKVGGNVLSCGPEPRRLEGALSERGAQLAASPGWVTVAMKDLVHCLPPQRLAIRRSTDDKGLLFHHRRELADGDLVFLANTSLAAPSTGEVSSSHLGVERWNLKTGGAEPLDFHRTPQGISVAFKLEPCGSELLFFSKKALKPAKAISEVVETIQPQGPPSIRRASENVLTLDYVDVKVGDESRSNIYFYAANKLIWTKHGLKANPWDNAVQFKDELISHGFANDSGFEAAYRFQIQSSVPTNLAIVVERPDLYEISCNGRPVRGLKTDWWLDKTFGRIFLSGVASVGENVVTLKASPLTMFHELEPAYLIGSFSLQSAETGFIVCPDQPLQMGPCDPGAEHLPWNAQGHPFYGAGVGYSETFNVVSAAGRFSVALSDWYGSVAKVSLNGKLAGYIEAPPWECNVSDRIKAGSNTVEVTVIGTLKNTLGPHHGNPGLGAAWPRQFQSAPEAGPPPGTNYSTVGYGLFRPFVLKQTRSR